MTDKECKELLDEAIKARELSYSPYSKFKVGAAYKQKAEKYIEAEYRKCFFHTLQYVPKGQQYSKLYPKEKKISAIAIVCDSKQGFCFPCGVCRQ
jgi:cytidine deaminase